MINYKQEVEYRADLLQRAGTYPSPAGWPEWMGLELSGEIIEMGDEAKNKCSISGFIKG